MRGPLVWHYSGQGCGELGRELECVSVREVAVIEVDSGVGDN